MRSFIPVRLILFTALPIVFLFMMGSLLGCSTRNQLTAGPTKKMSLAVGDIKEVSLPGSDDGSFELIGTSDNQEVVEVSRQQLAPPTNTPKRTDTGSGVFQIKGITVGKTNVVFSKKAMGAAEMASLCGRMSCR